MAKAHETYPSSWMIYSNQRNRHEVFDNKNNFKSKILIHGMRKNRGGHKTF
jgi:hypothetical protein